MGWREASEEAVANIQKGNEGLRKGPTSEGKEEGAGLRKI